MFGFFNSSSSSGTTEIKNYGVFTDGVNLTNNKIKEINAQNEAIRSIRTILQNDGVFMGPIRDSSVKALESAENKLSIIEENLATISMYLAKTSESYQNADSKACEVISLNTQTGKMEIKTGSLATEYNNPKNISGYQLDFINEIKDGAIEGYNKYGILPSLTLAQAIQETGWGKHTPKGSNNIFGIKASDDWTGKKVTSSTQENYGGKYVTINADFRAYDSKAESVEDHAKLLKEKSRYAKVLTAKNYEDACHEIKKAGYATGEKYDEHLINLIKLYGLDQWDPK